MNFLENYMEAKQLPEASRQLLRQQAQHSMSCYTLDGRWMETPLDKEDLLAVIMARERYIVDSNSSWKKDVVKLENRNKAFILGKAVLDEPDDLSGNLFGRKVVNSHHNIFLFCVMNPQDLAPHLRSSLPAYLIIDRHDSNLVTLCDKEKLRRDSQPREKHTDQDLIERERQHMAKLVGFKQWIYEKLGFCNLDLLPPLEQTQQLKAELIRQHPQQSANMLQELLECC